MDEENLRQRFYGTHINEEIERRWQQLSLDSFKYSNNKFVNQMKQLQSLQKTITNSQQIVQVYFCLNYFIFLFDIKILLFIVNLVHIIRLAKIFLALARIV